MAGGRKDTIVSQRQEQRQRPSLRGSQERAKAYTNPLPSAPPDRTGDLLKAVAWLGLHWGGCEESSGSWLGQEDGLLRGGSPGSPDTTAAVLWHVPLAAVLTLVAGLGHQDVPLHPSLLPLLGSSGAAVSWTNAGGLGPGPFQYALIFLGCRGQGKSQKWMLSWPGTSCICEHSSPEGTLVRQISPKLSPPLLRTLQRPGLTWSKSSSPSWRPHASSPFLPHLSSIPLGPSASTRMSKSPSFWTL